MKSFSSLLIIFTLLVFFTFISCQARNKEKPLASKKSITKQDATNIAEAIIKNTNENIQYKYDFVIINVEDKNFGWIFNFTSKKYLETKDPLHSPLGGSKILVDRYGNYEQLGSIPQTNTHVIQRYEDEWTKNHPIEK